MVGISSFANLVASSQLTLCSTAAAFTGKLGSIVAPLWATFTGLSFALQKPTEKFITCCIFVFSKQPYNIGDRVKVKDGEELKVIKVFLMYSVFQQVKDGILVEMEHMELITQNISNLTRSKHRGMAITVSASEEKLNEDQIGKIRDDLHKFVEVNKDCCRFIKTAGLEWIWTDNGSKKELHLKIEYKRGVSKWNPWKDFAAHPWD
jgi:hypothetical protein